MTTQTIEFKAYHFEKIPETLSARLTRLSEILDHSLERNHGWSKSVRAHLAHWQSEIEAGRLICPVPQNDGNDAKSPFNQSVMAEFLESIRDDASDADWLTLWESLQAMKNAVEGQQFRHYIGENRGFLAESVAEEMSSLFPTEEALPFTQAEMQEVVGTFLQEWLERTDGCPTLLQQVQFIRLFFKHLVQRYSMPLDFWQILLARLRLYANKGVAIGRASVWEEAISCLEDCPGVITSGHGYFQAVAENPAEAESPWIDWLPTLAVVRQSKRALREHFPQALTLDFFPAENDLLLQPDAGWMAVLRESMERSALDPLDEQRHWLRQTRERFGQIERAVESWSDSVAKTAEDLAQGLTGAKPVADVTHVLRYLTNRALWVVAHESAISWARKSFAYEMVTVGGIDMKSEVWKKLSQIVVSAQNLIRGSSQVPGANEAALLLDAVRERGEEMRNFDLSVLQPLISDNADLRNLSGERCQRDTSLTLKRLLVETRLQGMSGAVPATIRWYGSEVAPYLVEVNPSEIADTLEDLAEDATKMEACPFAVTRLLRSYSQEFPRLIAAHQLLRNAEGIATATADYVFERLPHYDEKVGANGRTSCARDNQLTIERTAQLILAGTEDPGEALLEWWSSVVGAYLANRPEGLFESNLQGLYNGIQAHLNNREVAMAFEPIALVYRETIGVECMDAKASLPLPYDGTLWKAAIGKRVSAYGELYDWDASFYDDVFENLAGEFFPDSSPDLLHELLGLWRRFLENVGRHGDTEAAAKPLYPRLIEPIKQCGTEPIARFFHSASQHLLQSEGLSKIALLEATRALNEQIGQLGLALKMRARVREIANAFPEALREVAPDFFPEEKAESVHEKCVRDQTLLLDRLTQLGLSELPTTYWLSAPRYCMEILLPHVDYPTEIWNVAFRNVAVHLAADLDFHESRALTQWLAQWEDYAHGFAGSSAICREFFHLGDYTFSADEEEETQLRGLLAATLTAAMTSEDAPVSGESILRRYLLSINLSAESARTQLMATVDKLRRALGDHNWPALDRSLDHFLQLLEAAVEITDAAEELSPQYAVHRLLRTPRSHDALWKSIAIASHISPEMSALCAQECGRLKDDQLMSPDLDKIHPAYESWAATHKALNKIQTTGEEVALLDEILVTHLIYPLDGENRSADSPFSEELVARLGETLFAHGVNDYAAHIRRHTPMLIEHTQEPFRLRSNLRRAVALIPRVEAGVSLWGAGLVVPEGEERDESTTSPERMPYSALQPMLAQYLFAPAIRPAVFGNGFFREHFASAQFRQTSDHYSVFLNGLLQNVSPRRQLPVLEVFLATQNTTTPLQRSSWQQILQTEKATTPLFVGEASDPLSKLGESAARHACPRDESERGQLQDILADHLDALVCGLSESGDTEHCIEHLKALLVDDLARVADDTIISGYYGILRLLPEYFAAEQIPFWYQFMEAALQAVREVSLGRAIAELAATGAEKITAKLAFSENDGESGERGDKCIRDQRQLVHALAYAWQTHSSNRLVLQIGRFLLQTTLPHLSEETPLLGGVFTLYEEVFEPSLGAQQKQALWQWTGRWQRIILQLAPLAKFYATTSAHMPKAEHPFVRSQDEDDFLAGLIVAAATPAEGALHPEGVLGRLLLGSDILRRPYSGQALTIERNMSRWKDQGIALPLKFREVVESWERCLQLAKDLIDLTGPHIVRASGIYGQCSLGRMLWQNTVLARSQAGQNHTTPADLRVAEALRLDIPEPALAKKLHQQLQWLKHSWEGLDIPESAPPKKGLLRKFVSREAKSAPVDREALKQEACVIAYTLSVYEVLGRKSQQLLTDFFFCPQTRNRITRESAEGIFRFYRDVVEALVESVGETHPLTRQMRSFQSGLEDAYRAHRLLEGDLPGGQAGRFLALYQWDLKDLSAATAYSPDGSDDPLLAVNQMQKRFLQNLPETIHDKDREALKGSWSQILATATQ